MTLLATARTLVKQAAGQAAAAALPQCSFSRTLFVLGHMRCGSTALANVLCAHPAISGYGETHVAYDHPAALGQLVINQQRRGAWNPAARHLFDKILHSRYDGAADRGFCGAHAIFLVREPVATVLSIRTLFARLGSPEYASDAAAADYYEERLGRLTTLWNAFAPERRIGLSHAGLTADPDRALAQISAMLALDPPLANRYERAGKTLTHGAGDPLSSHRFGAIVPAERTTSLAGAARALDLPPARIEQLQARFAETCQRFGCPA